MKRKIILILMSLLMLMMANNPVLAAETIKGEKIFSVQCAGCHPQGNNIIRRGKNLKLKTLHRNKVDSLEAIAYLVANGKNNMSAFKDRLSEREIEEVSAYVLQQAQTNWQQ